MRWMCAILFVPLVVVMGQNAADDAASVRGQVSNAVSGEPLRNALVYLRRVDSSPGVTNIQVTQSISSDSAGRFAITGITPGKYRLTAERSGFLATQYGARSISGSGTLMTLEAGQKINDVSLRMTPHGVISGRVVDEDGEPVMSAPVEVAQLRYVQGKKQLSRASSSSTNDLGEYRLFGLRPGRYYVSVNGRPNPLLPETEDVYVNTFFPRTTDITAAVPVDLTPGAQLRNIDIALRKVHAVTVSGRVANEVRPPAAGEGSQRLSVMLSPRNSGIGFFGTRGAMVTPQGTFEVRSVPPGSYYLTAVSQGGGKTVTTKIPIQVGNVPLEGLSLVIRAGVPVTGKVKADSESTESLTRVRLSLQPLEMGGVQFAPLGASQVKEDGSFVLEEVGADQYTLGVGNLPAGFYVKSIRSGDVDVLVNGLEIAGQSPAPLEVVLGTHPGQVTVTVMDGKVQKPAIDATVVLVPQDPVRRTLQQFYRTATTNAAGQFTFKDVVPGEYRAYAWEETEFGAWMDPDYLKPFENLGEKVSVEEGGRPAVQVNLISAGGQ